MSIKTGDVVRVPCDVQPGPFLDRRLVTVETVDGAISGFVNKSQVSRDAEQWEVRGKVQAVTPTAVHVWIPGSFFTTSGMAAVPRERALAA